jgi:hypothetical protein
MIKIPNEGDSNIAQPLALDKQVIIQTGTRI